MQKLLIFSLFPLLIPVTGLRGQPVSMCKNNGDSLGYCKVIDELIDSAIIMRDHNYGIATRLADSAYQYIHVTGNLKKYARYLLVKGAINSNNGRIAQSRAFLESALKMAEHNNWDDFTSKACRGLGISYLMAGDHETALKYFLRQLSYIPVTEDAEEHVIGYCNIGVTFYKLQASRKALGYFFKAMKLDRRQQILTRVLGNIGLCYNQLSLYDSALFYYDKALSLQPSPDDVINCGYGKTVAYIGLNEFSKASTNVDKALMLARSKGDLRRLPELLLEAARIELLQGRHEWSIKYLIEAETIAANYSLKYTLQQVLALKADYYKAIYNYKARSECLSLYASLERSTSGISVLNKVSSLENEFEEVESIAKIEKQNALMRLNSQKNELRAGLQYLGSLVFCLLAILCVWLFNLKRLQTKQNAVLEDLVRSRTVRLANEFMELSTNQKQTFVYSLAFVSSSLKLISNMLLAWKEMDKVDGDIRHDHDLNMSEVFGELDKLIEQYSTDFELKGKSRLHGVARQK